MQSFVAVSGGGRGAVELRGGPQALGDLLPELVARYQKRFDARRRARPARPLILVDAAAAHSAAGSFSAESFMAGSFTAVQAVG